MWGFELLWMSITYEFPIRQSGTYWYHSRSNLQVQSGVYGSIVIKPRHQHQHEDGDHVILFSDWTTEDPHMVLRSLKRGSKWHAACSCILTDRQTPLDSSFLDHHLELTLKNVNDSTNQQHTFFRWAYNECILDLVAAAANENEPGPI